MWAYQILVIAFLCGSACRLTAQTTLTADQIQAAINHGRKYPTQEKYLSKGLKKKRFVDLVTVGMSSKYVIAFGDWDAIAAEAALAQQQMKPFGPSDIKLTGNLHVLLKIYDSRGFPQAHSRFASSQSNLVLRLDDVLLQPVRQEIITEKQIVSIMGSVWILFDYAIEQGVALHEAVATFIDANGKRYSHKIDLTGVLEPPSGK